MTKLDRLRNAARDAVLQMEDARGSIVLDDFECDGKRYVITVKQAPREKVTGVSALSAREREVVAAAAAGRTNKVIAHDLGVAHSTVRVLLARAAKRLNATSRHDLVSIYEAFTRAT